MPSRTGSTTRSTTRSTTKARLLDTAAELFRRQGYASTGLKQLTVQAGAPFGSLYHHFPGGKDELAEAVIRGAADYYLDLALESFDPDLDPPAMIRAMFAGAADHLRESDYADACPVATVALEVASTNDRLRQATHDVFEIWLAWLESYFTDAGMQAAAARTSAVHFLIALEGAFLLGRASRSTEALSIAGDAVAAQVAAELATGP
ncbi:TetR/AcrR family transcriptional regulator [Desertimonas flava]|uniref:TetR/AcrR family transcriptional regulator n=1 Tax=Desertimonas flava TaxID=2064846 RepID=UPI0023F2863D|nr:TetR/AcrR family transcriptional regulator [Desertimonas flava]